MRLYSGLVERCFNACAQDYTTKVLTGTEVSQAMGCGICRMGWRRGAVRYREWEAQGTS
jgi:hypothetical protein